jgi:hypothetical protein
MPDDPAQEFVRNWKPDPEVWREHDTKQREQSRPPPGETIEWHCTYLVEAYLPSHAERLHHSLAELGWEKGDWPGRYGRPLVPVLRESAYGGSWNNLGLVLPRGRTPPLQHTNADRLPDGVDHVALTMWSVTSSLTLLIANFVFDEEAGLVLDRIARTEYETVTTPTRDGPQRRGLEVGWIQGLLAPTGGPPATK